MENPLIAALKSELPREARSILSNLEEYDIDLNDSDSSGMTALCYAIRGRFFDIVYDLISKNVNVNLGIPPPIILAFEINNYELVISLLRDTDADVNAQNPITGDTPLLYACEYGEYTIAESLLTYPSDVDVNTQNYQGETALIKMCKSNISNELKKRTMGVLLRYEANLNIQDNDGLTALMILAQGSDEQLVESILEYHPNVHLRSANGRTALDYAQSSEIIEMLEDAMEPDIRINLAGLLDDVDVDENPEAYYERVEREAQANREYVAEIENKDDYVEGDPIQTKINILIRMMSKSGIDSSPTSSQGAWNQKGAFEQSTSPCYDTEEVGVLCDYSDYEDHANNEYLNADKGNVIFMIKSGDGFKAFGSHIDNVVNDRRTDAYYECQGPSNINSDILFVKINLSYNVYVMISSLVSCLESKQRVFLISPSDMTIERSISYGIIDDGRNDIPQNYVSADHCQDGTDKKIFNIQTCYGENCL